MASISVPFLSCCIPNLYRLKNCWRLGHTAANCDIFSLSNCKNCDPNYDDTMACKIQCVNCSLGDHQADFVSCPAYKKMKTILKITTTEEISINFSRMQEYSRKQDMKSSNYFFTLSYPTVVVLCETYWRSWLNVLLSPHIMLSRKIVRTTKVAE